MRRILLAPCLAICFISPQAHAADPALEQNAVEVAQFDPLVDKAEQRIREILQQLASE